MIAVSMGLELRETFWNPHWMPLTTPQHALATPTSTILQARKLNAGEARERSPNPTPRNSKA